MGMLVPQPFYVQSVIKSHPIRESCLQTRLTPPNDVSPRVMLTPKLSLRTLRVFGGAVQHVLPRQAASAPVPGGPRWTPPAQPRERRQNNLAAGERGGERTRCLIVCTRHL